MPIFSLNVQAILNTIFAIPVSNRRYTGMYKKLLALGMAGVFALMSVLPAVAQVTKTAISSNLAYSGLGTGLGLGLGCGCCGFSLAGWWGPICGYPWGLFGGPFCW
jgi:hypothetical protein